MDIPAEYPRAIQNVDNSIHGNFFLSLFFACLARNLICLLLCRKFFQ